MRTLDFVESEEQAMVRDTAATVADEFGPEYWRELDATGTFPHEFWDALGEAGIHGLMIPEEYGGAGMGMVEMSLVIETLCGGGCGMGGAMIPVMSAVMGAVDVAQHGSAEQKERYLPGMATGERMMAISITEPDAGSNTLNTETTAEKDGDEYVIEGKKVWATLAHEADDVLVVTRTTPKGEVDKPTEGLSLFFVDREADGVELSQIPKHGVHYLPSNELFLDGVRVPEANLLGERDDGWDVLVSAINPERIALAAGAAGIGKLAAETAIDYANEREVFDGPIGQYQGVQFPIAEAHSQLETADLMRQKAAKLFDEGEECAYESNVCKAVAVDSAIDLVYHSMQTFGGWGYAQEYDVERWWREINLLRLAPVTQQMAWNYIAQELGFPRSY